MVRGAHGLSVSPLAAYASFGPHGLSCQPIAHPLLDLCAGSAGPLLGCLPVVLLQHCSVWTCGSDDTSAWYDHPDTCSGSTECPVWLKVFSLQTVSYPENCLVSLADFLGFVCEVSTRQKLSTFWILSLTPAFCCNLASLPTCLMLNKNVSYGLLTGDAFDWTTNELFLHERGTRALLQNAPRQELATPSCAVDRSGRGSASYR